MKSMVKRCFSLLLVMALAISGVTYLPVRSQTVFAADNVPEGYTPIRTVSDLYGIRNNLSGNYILMNDIDLTEATSKGGSLDTGHGWTPIDGFSGTFDGGGHRIKGMNIYGDVGRDCGLFGSVNGGNIKKLGLTDVNIDVNHNGTNSYGGCSAIAGEGYGHIDECFVTGSIAAEGFEWIGGISGDGSIKDCYSDVEIKTDAEVVEVGSISADGSVTRCYSRGSINGGTGKAIGKYLKDCVYLIGTGTGSESATPLTETQMKDANYYTNFDFNNVWELDSDSAYPYPQLRNCMQTCLTSLTWGQEPVKKEYNQGDVLDLSGGVLNYTYEDGASGSCSVTERMIAGHDMMQIGSQNITVRKGNMAVTYAVNINPIPVAGIILDKTELYMEKGDTETLAATIMPVNATDQRVEWSSANSSVATVDQTGKVRAIKNGETDIIATASNGQQAVCHVKVLILCTYISIDTSSLSGMYDSYDTYAFPKGSSVQLSYTMYPEKSTESVKWIIDDSSIVKIDDKNIMTCLKTGTTRITVHTDSGKEDSIYVKVTKGKSLKKVKGLKITSSKKKLTIQWKYVSNASGYYVQVAQNKKFTKKVKNYKVSDTRKVFKGKKKKKYYVRVRAYTVSNGLTIYGKYSAVKSKKTK